MRCGGGPATAGSKRRLKASIIGGGPPRSYGGLVAKRGLHPIDSGARLPAGAARRRAPSLDEAGAAIVSRLRGRLSELEAADRHPRLRDLRPPRGRRPQLRAQPRRRSHHGARLRPRRDRARRAARPRCPLALLARGPPGGACRRPARHRAAPLLLRQRPASAISSSKRRSAPGSRAPILRRLLRRAGDPVRPPARGGERGARPRGEELAESSAERRRECVKRLLAGELVDRSELGYDLDAQHLALMAKGEGVQEVMRELAARLDRRLLAVCREEEPIWACWLGGSRPLRAEQALRALGEIPWPGCRDRRRARRGALGLAAQSPPGEGGAADRRARRARRCSATPTTSCSPRSSPTTSSPTRCTSSTWRRWRGRGTAAGWRGRRCAPTSSPSGTSPRPPPRSASIAARSRNRLRAVEELFGRPIQDLGDRPRDRFGSTTLRSRFAESRVSKSPWGGARLPRGGGRVHPWAARIRPMRKHLLRLLASSPPSA